MSDLRVTLIADDPLARAGLAGLLATLDDCQVVDQLSSAHGRAALLDAGRQDVILWDLGWDPEPGLAALADQEEAGAPVLALAPGGEDEGEVARSAWAAGAAGVLLRAVTPERLLAGLRAVAAGLIVWEPTLAAALLPTGESGADSLVEPLTPREIQVLQLLAEGLPNKTIARRLDISDHTVKFHVNAILGKLQVQSRTEAVVRATRLGLVVL